MEYKLELKCFKCGSSHIKNTIDDEMYCICLDCGFSDLANKFLRSNKLYVDDILYHLIWMVEQYCGYMIEEDDTPRETRYNADARAVMFLEEHGYVKIVSEQKFPETKFIKFLWTPKGWEILNDNK